MARIWLRGRGSGWKHCQTRAPARPDLPAALPDRDRGLRFTAAGNDRLTAVGQWTRRAGQADLARLRAPLGPGHRPVPGAG